MSKEVLIVEDDRALAELLSRALKLAGYRVKLAHDGYAALEAIERSKPGLVLLDILLPRRDGRSVLAELRKKEATQDLPVIAMSGVLRRPKQARDLEEACPWADRVPPIHAGRRCGGRPTPAQPG